MQQVNATGKILIPTGREFKFKTYPNFRGEPEWPRTQILNYPVKKNSGLTKRFVLNNLVNSEEVLLGLF